MLVGAALAGLLNLTGGVILNEGTAVLIIANGLRMLRRPAAATACSKTVGSSSVSSTGPSSAGLAAGFTLLDLTAFKEGGLPRCLWRITLRRDDASS